MKTTTEIVCKLQELREDEFKNFSEKIVNSKYPILGVRSAYCKQIAKELSKLTTYNEFIYDDHKYYEEYLIISYLIGYLKLDLNKIESLLNYYLNFVDSWSLCDCLVSNLKIISKNREQFLVYIMQCLKSENVFKIRFGLVALLNYYVDDEYINQVLIIAKNVKNEHYYVKMANAWLLSICLVKQYSKTIKIIESKQLNTFTHNKCIQKAVESFRISQEKKFYLKSLKIKKEDIC